MVEQQYSSAVAVVLRVRSYLDHLLGGGGGGNPLGGAPPNTHPPSSEQTAITLTATNILKDVNEKSIHLASTIQKSILKLPNSQVDLSITLLAYICPMP
jgi:hypothetical protein